MLIYDYSFLPSLDSGDAALLSPVYAQIQADKQAGVIGFTKLPTADVSAITSLAAQIRSKYEALIVIGIGGSDLGARAVHRALNHQFYNQLPQDRRGGPRLYFLGDTTDPVAIQEVIDVVDMSKTAVAIISKSGNTIEQMSTFVYVRDLLIAAVGEEAMRQRVIMVTDASTGTLRTMVEQDGYPSLVVPSDVGGRFSVLSSVGLFPLAVAGIDIAQLLEGAASVDVADTTRAVTENPAAMFALHQYIAATRRGEHISVLMPYAYSLREVGFWYRQLWAESLGKQKDLEGKIVEVGPTPVAAVGPTDQHSQLQLYTEGPRDKIVTFVRVTELATNMTLPLAYPDLEGVRYLEGHSFAEIVQAEQQSTALALHEAGRSNCVITIDRLDAYHIGALLYFFEMAVTYAGALYRINTFDQPGVERSKQLMYGLLGRSGFEAPAVAETAVHQITLP